jgi:hypothetical protein
MTALFALSSVLLAVLLVGRHIELQLGNRFFVGPRDVLDRITSRMVRHVRNLVRRTFRYAHVDILMQGLHMVTYGALVLVRWVERKLVLLVGVLRRTHKKHHKNRAPSHKLARISGDDQY